MNAKIENAVNGAVDWFNQRTPGLVPFYKKHMSEYYAPKNFNFWYFFGSLALLVLVNQIVTGIFLTMHYKPSATEAFASVEYIMRDVEWGWLIRYMHSTGASLFFVVVYLHMFRALIYGSYQKPRELVWVLGMFIFLTLMAEAFLGYVLPWGQMSYWGAQVIINLFSAIPVIGGDLTEFIRGDFLVSDSTLNRFFALHVIALPLVILLLVVLHLGALHEVGSNNPDGVDIKKVKDKATGKPLDGIPFHPYYTVKDLVGAGVFLIIASFRGNKLAGFYLVSQSILLISTLLQISFSLGSLNRFDYFFSHYGLAFGYVVEAIILTVGLVYRFNRYRLDKEELLITLNQQQKENTRVLYRFQRIRKLVERDAARTHLGFSKVGLAGDL